MVLGKEINRVRVLGFWDFGHLTTRRGGKVLDAERVEVVAAVEGVDLVVATHMSKITP